MFRIFFSGPGGKIFTKNYKQLKSFLQESINKYNELQPKLQDSTTFLYYSDELCAFLYFI